MIFIRDWDSVYWTEGRGPPQTSDAVEVLGVVLGLYMACEGMEFILKKLR